MRFLALVAVVALAFPADAFVSEVRLRVQQGPGTDFTVLFNSQAKLTDYWCAAGNHVTNTQGYPDRTRVFRMSPPPRVAGEGISFTLDATRSAGDTGLSTFGGVQDGSMAAGSAFAKFCFIFENEF